MAAKSRKNEKKGKDEPSTPSYAVPIDKSRASACQAGATNLSEQFSDKIIRPRDDPGFRQLFIQARHAHRLGCVTIGVNMLEEARELKQVSEHGLLSRSYCHLCGVSIIQEIPIFIFMTFLIIFTMTKVV